MSIEKIGTLLCWSKKGYGIITIPIPGSKNVERYYLSQTRILEGPAVPTAGLKVRFEILTAVQHPGQLPAASRAIFFDETPEPAEPAGAADLLSGSKAVQQ